MEHETLIRYPVTWEEEYRRTGFVDVWRSSYGDMFADYPGSGVPGTLDLFAQYALMYILRRDQGVQSLTWYKLCCDVERSKERERVLRYWATMRTYMGDAAFELLQRALKESGLRNFTGEPDLFCWKEDAREWFFAEAKKASDKLRDPQVRWFSICRSVLGTRADIRVYRLVPDEAR